MDGVDGVDGSLAVLTETRDLMIRISAIESRNPADRSMSLAILLVLVLVLIIVIVIAIIPITNLISTSYAADRSKGCFPGNAPYLQAYELLFPHDSHRPV